MMPYIDRFTCEICGNNGKETKLIGSFETVLCLMHSREWDEFARVHPKFRAHLKLQTIRNAQTIAVRGGLDPRLLWEDLVVADENLIIAERAMHIVAKEWVERRVKENSKDKEEI